MILTRKFLLFMSLLFIITPLMGETKEVYVKTFIDDAKDLHVLTQDGRDILFKKISFMSGSDKLEQVGFDKIKISNDGFSVGWLSEYPNCCTSYPIPLKLSIYTENKIYTFTGIDLPIWDWGFTSNGEQIIFHQETVHGGLGVHYEIRDIKSSKLVKVFEPEIGQNNLPLPNQSNPKWVEEFKKGIRH